MKTFDKTAVSATLHCLSGCAVGEILGLIIATIIGLSTAYSISLAVGLAFFFGYLFSTLPLVKSGIAFSAAFSVVFAADTLSILTMEIVNNGIIALIPGALHSGIVNPIFWISMSFGLFVAFFVAYPVNKYQMTKGKGHALLHKHLKGQ